LRLVQSLALAMVLVVAGLVSGLQAHVIVDHPAAGLVGGPLTDSATDHGHSHDDPDLDGADEPDKGAGAAHDGVHHHVVDALVAWLQA